MARKNRNADQSKRTRPLLIAKPPPKIEPVPERKPVFEPRVHGGYRHSWEIVERGTG